METTITATHLARNLADVLNRVRYRNERFVVQRNGEPIAVIAPAAQPKPEITLGELFARLKELPPPDDRFADDLEEIHNSQPPMPPDPWLT